MARIPLSAVIICRNAEALLPDCLSAAAFADEVVVVVDSDSTDGSAEVAQHYGASVIVSHWRGFGAQKQYAIEQASNDWVLCLDADEAVTELLRDSIVHTLNTGRLLPAAFCFARRNRFLGRDLSHGEGYPDWSLRLFDRRRARWTADAVHERVETTGEAARLDGDLLHNTSHGGLAAYLEKQNRYTTLAAKAALQAGNRASVAKMLLSPLLRFGKFYLLRLGFLDGWPGLMHILIGCGNSFWKYAKMLEVQRGDPGQLHSRT